MVELMRGYTRHRGIDGYAFDLDPGDSRYRAPMSQDHALIAACMQFCILGLIEKNGSVYSLKKL